MTIIISILISNLLNLHSFDTSKKNELANTIWVAKVSSNCNDTLKFVGSSKVYSYSCEIENTSKGDYHVDGNTLILTINEDSHVLIEKWRYKFVLQKGRLLPKSSEQFSDGKWLMQKKQFDTNYFFVRLPF